MKTLHSCGSSRCKRSRGDDGDHKCIDTNWAPSYLNLYMGCFPTTLSRGRKLIKRKSSKRLGAKPTPARSLGCVRANKMNLRFRTTLGFLRATLCLFVFFTSMLHLFISDKMVLGKGRRAELTKLIDH